MFLCWNTRWCFIKGIRAVTSPARGDPLPLLLCLILQQSREVRAQSGNKKVFRLGLSQRKKKVKDIGRWSMYLSKFLAHPSLVSCYKTASLYTLLGLLWDVCLWLQSVPVHKCKDMAPLVQAGAKFLQNSQILYKVRNREIGFSIPLILIVFFKFVFLTPQ